MDIITSLVSDIMREHYEYLSAAERSSTETAASIANLIVKTAQLRANRVLAEQFFNKQLQERTRLFSSAHKVLEKAIEEGDIEWAQIAITIIEIVQKKTPFTD